MTFDMHTAWAIPTFSNLADFVPSMLASGANPLGHVLDKESALSDYLGFKVKLSAVSIVVAAILTFAALYIASRRIDTGSANEGAARYLTRGRISQLIEVMVQGIRDGALEPLLGKATTAYFLPFFLSLFFFILSLNLIGLIPLGDAQELSAAMTGSEDGKTLGNMVFFGGTATASISVTAGLAVVSFLAMMFQASRELGVKGFLEHMCGGKELLYGPKGLLLVVPIIFIVEVLGLFIKPSALAIRLFANMLAGHTLLATIFMFTAMAGEAGGWWLAGPISIVSALFAVAISFLELFVAFLQAFVFMFLTAVFIGMMSHHADHGEHDDHAHEDAHGAGVGAPTHAH